MTNPNSLRQKVFAKKKENNNLTLQDFYKFFKTSNRNSIKTYYGQSNKLYPGNISKNISNISKNKKPNKPSTVQSFVDDKLLEMEDTELIRQTCRMVIVDNRATFRDRLDAASKLLSLKDKSGTLNIKTKKQKEVYEQYKRLSNNQIANLLSKSTQKGLSKETHQPIENMP